MMKQIIAASLTASALTFASRPVLAKTPVAKYSVEQDLGNLIEIRKYPVALVAETQLVNGDKNPAFKILAAYIFGANEDKNNIGMTAPVDMGGNNIGMTAPVDSYDVEGNSYMRFYMPPNFTSETLPKPLDARVIIRELPETTRIVIRFSGRMSEANIAEHQALLQQVMHDKGIEALSAPILSGYDAPWTMWFLRRNEIAYIIKCNVW